jgi:asparagine synthase (glutamine-hydrolysing)
MCGIAGAIFWEDGQPAAEAMPLVQRMTDAMRHRGPDGQGVVRCARSGDAGRGPVVTLGHRRLAIIDLTDRAAQPMASPRGPVWIAFNGEIYNFQALRHLLESRGRTFQSDSDTEVLLQGYEEWGEDVLDRVEGMFALAIWDGTRRELLLARDRLGIKPVYFYQNEHGLLFASEIRALLASGLVPRQLDTMALEQFLAYQSVPPPRTLVEGVRMLAPGHLLTAGVSRRSVERKYWDLLDSASPDARTATIAESRVRVGDLLAEATRAHLVSDVPVGVFLSGGIDSSVLVALMHQAGVVPHSFGIAFPGTAYDESHYARVVAKAFGAEHTEIALTEAELCGQLPDAIASVDHPSGDGINTYVVARAVRAAGVKVALSGLGGDEFFGGYPSFRRLGKFAAYARAWRRSPKPMRAAAAAAVRTLGGASVASMKTAALLESDGSLPQTFPVMRQLFSTAERGALLGPDLVADAARWGDPYVTLLERAVERHSDVGLMSLVSYAESRTYMHDVLLRDTDQMSMRHGLEVRVPLLDHRLVEYVMGLPDAVKQAGDVPKRLLVESLGIPLPDECVNRPKRGFVLPFDLWMRGDLRPFCEHHLGPEGLAARVPFRAAAVEQLWRSFLANDGRTSWSRLWTLVALNAWLEQNGVTG